MVPAGMNDLSGARQFPRPSGESRRAWKAFAVRRGAPATVAAGLPMT